VRARHGGAARTRAIEWWPHGEIHGPARALDAGARRARRAARHGPWPARILARALRRLRSRHPRSRGHHRDPLRQLSEPGRPGRDPHLRTAPRAARLPRLLRPRSLALNRGRTPISPIESGVCPRIRWAEGAKLGDTARIATHGTRRLPCFEARDRGRSP